MTGEIRVAPEQVGNSWREQGKETAWGYHILGVPARRGFLVCLNALLVPKERAPAPDFLNSVPTRRRGRCDAYKLSETLKNVSKESGSLLQRVTLTTVSLMPAG